MIHKSKALFQSNFVYFVVCFFKKSVLLFNSPMGVLFAFGYLEIHVFIIFYFE